MLISPPVCTPMQRRRSVIAASTGGGDDTQSINGIVQVRVMPHAPATAWLMLKP